MLITQILKAKLHPVSPQVGSTPAQHVVLGTEKIAARRLVPQPAKIYCESCELTNHYKSNMERNEFPAMIYRESIVNLHMFVCSCMGLAINVTIN